MEQQRLSEILGKPEGRSLSFKEYARCVVVSIIVFIKLIARRI